MLVVASFGVFGAIDIRFSACVSITKHGVDKSLSNSDSTVIEETINKVVIVISRGCRRLKFTCQRSVI